MHSPIKICCLLFFSCQEIISSETLKKLLDEIEKTKRRVNALEFKIIPDLKESERFVKFRLEEMERENTTRLKHIKKKGAATE